MTAIIAAQVLLVILGFVFAVIGGMLANDAYGIDQKGVVVGLVVSTIGAAAIFVAGMLT